MEWLGTYRLVYIHYYPISALCLYVHIYRIRSRAAINDILQYRLIVRPRRCGRCMVSSLARSIKVSGTAREGKTDRERERERVKEVVWGGRQERARRDPKISRTETTLLLSDVGELAQAPGIFLRSRDIRSDLPSDMNARTTRTTGGLVTPVLTRPPRSAYRQIYWIRGQRMTL